jgi:hypothetical protein
MNKYMMATKAIHMLGDLSRKEADICVISEEDKENYIGSWVFGFGFFGVKFPKETTRELTQEEIDKYNKVYLQINNQTPIKLSVG